jgi:hypothetical protein
MVSSETGKMGIIRRARDSVTPPRIRYKDARQAMRLFLADEHRTKSIILAARKALEQKADDPAVSDFTREDARLSVDVLDALTKMENQLAGYDFKAAPHSQPKLILSGVEISVNADLLVGRTKGAIEQVGGALFRLTKADDETEAATAKRREIGAYAATLVHMHVTKHLSGNKQPYHGICMSIDVQCGDVHLAPKTYAQKALNLENACKFIAALWKTA